MATAAIIKMKGMKGAKVFNYRSDFHISFLL